MEFEKQLEEWMKLDYVLPEDLPNIELYMDQVTTFLEEQLKNTKRFEEDKIFTKTMINNYTKNHLLPPSNKKKYSRNHMILLIYIYYLKNFLSISDIKNLLDPLNEHFEDSDMKPSFYQVYDEIFHLNIIITVRSKNLSPKLLIKQLIPSLILKIPMRKKNFSNLLLLLCSVMISICENR